MHLALVTLCALKVCEFGLTLTDGSNAATVVPVSDRLPLLQTWVKSKHCMQSHVGKTLGTADEVMCSVFSFMPVQTFIINWRKVPKLFVAPFYFFLLVKKTGGCIMLFAISSLL